MDVLGWLLVALGVVFAVRLLMGEPVEGLDYDVDDDLPESYGGSD